MTSPPTVCHAATMGVGIALLGLLLLQSPAAAALLIHHHGNGIECPSDDTLRERIRTTLEYDPFGGSHSRDTNITFIVHFSHHDTNTEALLITQRHTQTLGTRRFVQAPCRAQMAAVAVAIAIAVEASAEPEAGKSRVLPELVAALNQPRQRQPALQHRVQLRGSTRPSIVLGATPSPTVGSVFAIGAQRDDLGIDLELRLDASITRPVLAGRDLRLSNALLSIAPSYTVDAFAFAFVATAGFAFARTDDTQIIAPVVWCGPRAVVRWPVREHLALIANADVLVLVLGTRLLDDQRRVGYVTPPLSVTAALGFEWHIPIAGSRDGFASASPIRQEVP